MERLELSSLKSQSSIIPIYYIHHTPAIGFAPMNPKDCLNLASWHITSLSYWLTPAGGIEPTIHKGTEVQAQRATITQRRQRPNRESNSGLLVDNQVS